jgi:hypothetical protein
MDTKADKAAMTSGNEYARNGMLIKRERHPEPTPNKPQGKRERERRMRQMAKANAA